MQTRSFIGFIAALKKSLHLVLLNENLGFVVKYTVLTVLLSLLVIIPVFVGSTVISALYAGSSRNSPTPQPLYLPKDNPVQLNSESSTSEMIRSPNVSDYNNLGHRSQNLVPVVIYMSVVFILEMLLAMFSATVGILGAVKIFEGNLVRVSQLIKEAYSKMWKMGLLMLVLTCVSFVGYMLFIVPGIIFTIMFMFAPYILVKENVGVFEAMDRSRKLVSGYKFNLFMKGVAYTLLMMAIIVPLMFSIYLFGTLLAFTLNAVSFLMLLTFYQDLVELKSQVAPANVPIQPAGTVSL